MHHSIVWKCVYLLALSSTISSHICTFKICSFIVDTLFGGLVERRFVHLLYKEVNKHDHVDCKLGGGGAVVSHRQFAGVTMTFINHQHVDM